MKAKYSFFQLKYNRAAGRKKVTRWCRVDQFGRVSYVEKRQNTYKDCPPSTVDLYKIGNTVCIASPLHQVLPSTKAEYTKMVKEAISHIL